MLEAISSHLYILLSCAALLLSRWPGFLPPLLRCLIAFSGHSHDRAPGAGAFAAASSFGSGGGPRGGPVIVSAARAAVDVGHAVRVLTVAAHALGPIACEGPDDALDAKPAASPEQLEQLKQSASLPSFPAQQTLNS